MLRLLLPMKTLSQEWEEFARRCYPDGIPPEQARQLQTAFMSGATVALVSVGEAAERLPEEAGAAYLGSLLREARGFAVRKVTENRARN